MRDKELKAALVGRQYDLRRALSSLDTARHEVQDLAETIVRVGLEAAEPREITGQDVYTVLRTGLDREETLAKGHADAEQLGGKIIRVDTWQFNDHPDGLGGTLTLYAISIVMCGHP